MRYYSSCFLLPLCNFLCNPQHIPYVGTSPLHSLLLDIATKDVQLCSASRFYRPYIRIFVLLFSLSFRFAVAPPLAPRHSFQALIFFALLGCDWRTHRVDSGCDHFVVRCFRLWCLGLPEWRWQILDVVVIRFFGCLRLLSCFSIGGRCWSWIY